MAAVGSLGEVWTEFPDGDEAEFKRYFACFFNAPWQQVMVGAEKPFAMHLYWDAYFSVRKITPVSSLTLADLTGVGQGLTRFNIVVG